MEEEGNRRVLVGGRLRSLPLAICSGVVRHEHLGSKNIQRQPRFDEEYYMVMYISMEDIWKARMRGKSKKTASPSSVGIDFL